MAEMSQVESQAQESTALELARPQRSWLHETVSRLVANRGATVGLVTIILMLVVVMLAPVFAPYDPIEVDVTTTLASPSLEHPLGTDTIGRDVLSRIIYGGRISIRVGFIAILIACGVGLPLGMIAGYYGAWVDRICSRLIDVLLAFPGILLALAVVAVLGSSVTNATVAVGISLIPGFFRLARSSYLTAKENVYVEAARVIGARDYRIIIRHILPNVIASIMVLATVAMGWAIIIGASLSFLGLGVQAPTPEWGADLAAGREWIRTAWWLSTFPGIAIMILIVAVNLLGDGLRDALDPRLRSR